MGNKGSTAQSRPSTAEDGEEIAVRLFVLEAAGRGARLGMSMAVKRARGQLVPVGGALFDAVRDVRVAGVLPVTDAAAAAAEGACAAVQAMGQSMRPASWLPCSDTELTEFKSALTRLEGSAAAFATTGVYVTAAFCAAYKKAARLEEAGSLEEVASLEPLPTDLSLTEAVVATAARPGCIGAFTEKQAPANRWASILTPLLAACLPAASAAYPHFANTSYGMVLGIYGGLFVLVITLMVGVLAVPFRTNIRPESISRHAAFASMMLIAVLATSVMCTLLSDWRHRAAPLVVGSVAVIGLFILCLLSGRR